MSTDLPLDPTTLDRVPDGVLVVDGEAWVLQVNRAMCEMFGYTPDQLLCMNANQLVAPEERERTSATRERFFASRRPFLRGLTTRLHADGRRILVDVVLARLPDARPDAPGRALVMFRDALAQSPEVADLRDREAFLRSVLDHSQHGVWIIGGAGEPTYANDAMASMMGYDTEEFLHLPLERRFHPDEVERIRDYTAARRAGQDAPTHYRTRLLHRDGRTLWVDRSVTMLPMGDGQEHILIEHRDVTADVERAEQERSAQRAEAERLQRILASFQNGIIITDNQANVVFVNPAMASMLGYTPEEYLATTFAQRIHPEDVQRTIDIARDRLAGTDVPNRYRLRMLHRDGSTVWVDRSVALVVANGVIEGTVAENMDVTEQVLQTERAAAAQRAETERLQSILDNFRVGVTIRAPGGRTLFCNPAMAEMLGYSIEGFMARPILEHVHPEDREMIREFGRRRTAGEDAPQRYRVRLMHRTGRTVWVDRNVSTMTFDGVVEGTLAENVDITEQVLREEQEAAAQRAETARLRRILDTFQSGVAIFDLAGGAMFCNPAMANMLGYTVDEFLALPPFGHIHPDDTEMVRGIAGMRVAGLEVPERYRVRMRHRDGSVVIVDRSVTLISTPGEPAAILVEHRDVTEDVRRAEQEQAVRDMAAQRLQSLVSAAMAVNSAATVEDRLRVLTEVARTLIPAHQSITSLLNGHSGRLGITAISLSDRYARWRDYDVPTDGSGIYRLVLDENRPFRMTQEELEAHPAWRGFGSEHDHHPPMRGWLAAPLRGPAGQPIGMIQLSDRVEGEFSEADEDLLMELATVASAAVMVARTLEAQRSLADRLAEQVERATAQLQEQNHRLQHVATQRQEFLSTLSHELRTPLNVVLGYAQLLAGGQMGELNDDQVTALDDVLASSRHLAAIIADLLDLSRIDAGRTPFLPEPCAPGPAVAHIVEELAALARPGVTVYAEVAAAPPDMTVDHRAFRQVLTNLVGNAIKFTERGEVAVRVRAVDGDRVEIAVRDTGPGIAAEDLPHLFEAYWRSNLRSSDGTGLGLPIAQRLVEAMGGSLSVRSTPGEGSVFTVTLPREVRAS
ncbi:MAG: hypothetical protein CVU47_09885 [Chloroflexi bacterium HGW-Chloroflexi-9]|nr:MAG: hypothetical protein CVU47_09885 [Chloroflexi bacterium HGW-Chloroflexi-9]